MKNELNEKKKRGNKVFGHCSFYLQFSAKLSSLPLLPCSISRTKNKCETFFFQKKSFFLSFLHSIREEVGRKETTEISHHKMYVRKKGKKKKKGEYG